MSGFTQLRYEVADGVATVTLDRPDARNAFTQVMSGEPWASGRP
jgi:enoyl-CoA hydratase/carnithine racemase